MIHALKRVGLEDENFTRTSGGDPSVDIFVASAKGILPARAGVIPRHKLYENFENKFYPHERG